MFDANTNLLAESFGGLYSDAVVKESVPHVITDEEFHPINNQLLQKIISAPEVTWMRPPPPEIFSTRFKRFGLNEIAAQAIYLTFILS